MTDAALAELIAEVERDPASAGLILHGSRASAAARPDSDFDLIRVISEEPYARRAEQGSLLERRDRMDILHQSPGRLVWLAENTGWWTATYVSARVLLDKTGEIERLVSAIVERAGERARSEVPERYDGYLNCFVRSLKAWRRGDELGGRLHAAESSLYLIRTLFGLESRWPPYHDQLSPALPALEEAQGWPRGFLQDALRRLIEAGDPEFQQELERRVERLLGSRGVAHEWGQELEPLKALDFPSLNT